MKRDLNWDVRLAEMYLGGHPEIVPHLHLAADPTAWTRHPLHLHFALLHIDNTVVPTHTHTHTEYVALSHI